MSDKMQPIEFRNLMKWITEEFSNHQSIFGISDFFSNKNNNCEINVFGKNCETPIGPAAGPHTQLSQNIVVAYLCGG